MSITAWSRKRRFGGAENGDDADTQKCGEMHRPGVIGDQQVAFAKLLNEFCERGLTNQVGAGDRSGLDDRVRQLAIFWDAEDAPLAPGPFVHRPHHVRKALREPAFGGPVFGAGADSEDRR